MSSSHAFFLAFAKTLTDKSLTWLGLKNCWFTLDTTLRVFASQNSPSINTSFRAVTKTSLPLMVKTPNDITGPEWYVRIFLCWKESLEI
jgi:hypothetical protein